MPDKTTRRFLAEQTETEEERLQLVLNQGLDEWLRVYVVGLMKNVTAQPDDPTAIDRARTGLRYAVQLWKQSRALIEQADDA